MMFTTLVNCKGDFFCEIGKNF